ncbi:MAG: hypothetical protein EA357_07965 [Micavibrio sp.]|nr:MAG: hypothetical protein EA357_07965 [Micavibrio sp.]
MAKITYQNQDYDLKTLITATADIARTAGEAIMQVYDSDDFGAEIKSDNSPVTAADKASEAVILPAIKKLTPDIPILSEEDVAAGNIPDISKGTFWTVDPLDGTKDFIEKNGGFAVLISLVHDGKPVMGIIYHPAQATLYTASVPDKIALKYDEKTQEITDLNAAAQKNTSGGLRAVINKSSGDVDKITEFLKEKTGNKQKNDGSVAEQFKRNKRDILSVFDRGACYVFCPVAEGKAELYAHVSKSKGDGAPFWDVAAGHALIEAAGGRVTDFDGKPLRYAPDPQKSGAKALRTPPYVATSRTYALRHSEKTSTAKPPKPTRNL